MILQDVLGFHEGIIDVWLVMEEGKRTISEIEDRLGDRANLVYFTPSTSHREIWREQKIVGDYGPNRPAIISDIGFWQGESFEEVFEVMKSRGYIPEQIYAFYMLGYTGGKCSASPFYLQEMFDKAEKIKEAIAENQRVLYQQPSK